MPVQINISGENAEQAIQEFAVLSSAFVGAVSAPAAEPAKGEKPKRQRTTKPKEEPVKEEQESVEDDAAEDGSAEDAGNDDENSDEPIPTDVELRAKAQEVGKTAAAKKAIKDLLTEYGVSKLTALPDEKRHAFMVDLEKLG